ncbi:MAG: amidase, partial [Marinilabilia sp.]
MQPNIEVGIMFTPGFSFELKGLHRLSGTGETFQGHCKAQLKNGQLYLKMSDREEILGLPVELELLDYETA